ncbi:MAG: hypothetical protein ACKVN9_02120 [Methylophilaceae bacterium]
MAITSAPLDSIDAQSALQRKSVPPSAGVRGTQAATSDASFVSNISPAGQAMLALDKFQESAEVFKNSGSYRTVRYLQVMVQGVVGSLNALRNTLTTAATTRSRYSAAMGSILNAIDKSVGEGDLTALRQVGIERNKNGGFAINQEQVVKAFNEDSVTAFSAVTDFAYKVSKAPPILLPSDNRRPQIVTASEMNDEFAQTPAETAAAKESDRDVSMLQRIAAQLADVGDYTARKAVSIYRTVYAL